MKNQCEIVVAQVEDQQWEDGGVSTYSVVFFLSYEINMDCNAFICWLQLPGALRPPDALH